MPGVADWANNATAFAWTHDGELRSQTDPNGLAQKRTYDPDGHTADIKSTSSSGSNDRSFACDLCWMGGSTQRDLVVHCPLPFLRQGFWVEYFDDDTVALAEAKQCLLVWT